MTDKFSALKSLLQTAVAERFDAKITDLKPMRDGMSGELYVVRFDKPPYCAAVKTAKHAELLKKETAAIRTIRSKVDVKLPELYYEYASGDTAFVVMQLFDGVDCSDPYLIRAKKSVRRAVADEIADNIIKLQAVKGDKYGSLEHPEFDRWHDFYRPFAERILKDAEGLVTDGLIKSKVCDALKTGILNYDLIFSDPVSAPTLIHGDYWAKNVMIDRGYHLIGVLDPFNSMWADSEYELFALNAVYGKRLPVLEAFLKKTAVSERFFLKNSFYILFSEVYWVTVLRHDNNRYLDRLTKDFYRQMKRFNVKK